MRNLIRIHCKRYLFRWETFAVTMLNLMLSVFCTIAAIIMFDYNETSYNTTFFNIIHTVTLISIICTIAAVIFTEINTLATGAIRNSIIAGYTKGQIFISKYISVGIFGILQGALFIIPPVLADIWNNTPIIYTISMLLVYAVTSCVAMTVCLLTDRPTIYVVICLGCFIGLIFGGKSIAGLLDGPQFISARVRNETIIKEENIWYIPSPQRDILEQCVRINPLQPIYEYRECDYHYINPTAYIKDISESVYSKSLSEVENECIRFNIMMKNNDVPIHARRLKLFPIYQTVFWIVFGVGGMLVFRKRNLK